LYLSGFFLWAGEGGIVCFMKIITIMTREEIRYKNILIIKLRLLLKMGQKEAVEKAAKELEDLINEERIKNRKQ